MGVQRLIPFIPNFQTGRLETSLKLGRVLCLATASDARSLVGIHLVITRNPRGKACEGGGRIPFFTVFTVFTHSNALNARFPSFAIGSFPKFLAFGVV